MTTNKVHEWTKNKRWDKFDENGKHVIEDVCEHGVGHEWGTHGCDGCCAGIYPAPEKQQQAPRANCIYKNEDCPKCPTQKHDEIGIKCTLDFCPNSHTPEAPQEKAPDPFGDFLESQGHKVVDVTPSPQEPTPTSVTGEEWEEVKSEDHWLEVKDPDGWYGAVVKWDGCIHYTKYSNEPMSEDEENQDYLHICDIQSEIDRLYSLLQVARKHYKNHHYYETAFAKEPSIIEAQRTHIKQALLGRVEDKRMNGEFLYDIGSEFSTPRDYRRAGYNCALDDIINIINEELA